MAWLVHSSGPWKDHKYKERTGTPGNYTYKYGNEESKNGPTVKTWNHTDYDGFRHPYQTVDTYANDGRGAIAIRNTNVGDREDYKRGGSREAVRDTYYADRTGYQRVNNARHDLVGDDNEAKKKHVRYNDRRKQFESQTLSAMRNALNSAKENNKQKSDADMRDAAVARGREQYMTNRAAKTVNNIQNAVRKKKEEEKRAAYQRDLARRAAYGR